MKTETDIKLHMFQSLLGFLMTCNGLDPDEIERLGMVSIPIGFSNDLQRYGQKRCFPL